MKKLEIIINYSLYLEKALIAREYRSKTIASCRKSLNDNSVKIFGIPVHCNYKGNCIAGCLDIHNEGNFKQLCNFIN